MKYRVLTPLIYGGVSYKEDSEVDILEKTVAENCIERKLIEEIKEDTEENIPEEKTKETTKKSNKNKK